MAIQFIAIDNAVTYVKDGVGQLTCLCYGTPGLGERGADVAKVIAEWLNVRLKLQNEKGQEDDSD